MTIKIAIAGHTNIGKTTLIRTLMRTSVGEIGDAANVTKKGRIHYYDGLQAIFIDTPGFQYSSIAIDYLNKEQLSIEKQKKLEFDLEAINSIKESDVVIYLANLSIVPDGTYEDEIEIVRKIQPKIVGILNQYYQNLQGLGSEMVNQRCLQWKNILHQKGVNSVIVFDAHWDKRSKEKQIYDAIYKVLDDNQKSDFSDGVQKFKERQHEIREEVCLALADSIENLQKINIKVKKAEYESDQKEKCREKVINVINRETVKFIAYVSKLYEVAAEYPTDSSQDLIVKVKNRISVPGRIAMSTGGSAFLGTFGAIFGGVLGAIVVGFLSGGAGIIPGAIQGAQVLGAVGAGLGALAIFGDDGDQIDIRMTSLQIEDIVKSLLAIVWGLEHNGFGRGRNLSAKEVEDMKSLINELHAKQMIYDWTRINQGEVIYYCKNMLIKLEDY